MNVLTALDNMTDEPHTPKLTLGINSITGMLDTLINSLKGQKLNVNFDDTSEDDLLISFFGSNDIKENEKKLKVLRMKLTELNSKQS